MVNFGVIGFGYWGPNIVRNLASLDGSRVVVIAKNQPRRAKARAKDIPRRQSNC